jgi:hypothetical protein
LIVGFVGVGFLAACGGSSSSVEGNTYEGGGAVSMEFKSGGKAVVSLGPASMQCTYSQSGKSVSVTCDKDKMELTVADDGSLSPGANIALPKLTKKKA